MKIGIELTVVSNGYWGDDKYNHLRALGFDCVDFGLSRTENVAYKMPEDEARAYLTEERKKIEAAGLTVSQIHGPWRWPPQDSTPEDRMERMQLMKKSLSFVSCLGTKYWVIHPLMPFGVQDKTNNEAEKTHEINLAFMTELLETAKQYGVVICLENMPMPQFSIGSPAEIMDFVREIDDPSFCTCLDTGHVAVYKDISLAEAVDTMGDKLRVLHLHDNNGISDLHWLPYFGVSDWKGFSEALKRNGFDGVLSVEAVPPRHMPPAAYDKACAMLAEIAKSLSY